MLIDFIDLILCAHMLLFYVVQFLLLSILFLSLVVPVFPSNGDLILQMMLIGGILSLVILMVLKLARKVEAQKPKCEVTNCMKCTVAEKLVRAQEVAKICSWELDANTLELSWSPCANRLFNGKPPKNYGDFRAYVSQSDLPEFQRQWLRLIDGENIDFRHRLCIDGKEVWVREQARFDFAGDVPVRGEGAIQDVTEEHRAAQKISLAENMFANANEGILIVSRDGTITDVNHSMERISGFQKREIVGRKFFLLLSGNEEEGFCDDLWRNLLRDNTWSGEIRGRRKNNEVYLLQLNIIAMQDQLAHDPPSRFIAMATDITEARDSQKQIAKLAFYDVLTDLPNRNLFSEHLQAAVNSHDREGGLIMVGYLDLDDFKSVNEKYHHQVGDQLLQYIARRITNILRPGDIVSRFGGDEFALFANIHSLNDCDIVVSRLLDELHRPFEIPFSDDASSDVTEVAITASIGLALYPDDSPGDSEAMIRNAFQAMYVAKKAGGNCYHIHSEISDRAAHQHSQLIAAARRAVENNEFLLYYQPKVNMVTGAVIGAEGLSRWQTAEGIIGPSEFISVIDSGNLTALFTRNLLKLVLTTLQKWHQEGIAIPVSINIFPQQLRDQSLPKMLEEAFAEFPDVPPSLLELEIIETQHVGNFHTAAEALKACRQMGVLLSIDDFGTGHSSLQYLNHLPVNTIKIDQAFVRDIMSRDDPVAIIKAMLGLADAFNFEVIAEGVETLAHGVRLIEVGCFNAQGFAIGKPMPESDFRTWLENWRPPSEWKQ